MAATKTNVPALNSITATIEGTTIFATHALNYALALPSDAGAVNSHLGVLYGGTFSLSDRIFSTRRAI